MARNATDLQVAGHALDGAERKQVRGELDVAGDGVLLLGQLEREVHLRRATSHLGPGRQAVSALSVLMRGRRAPILPVLDMHGISSQELQRSESKARADSSSAARPPICGLPPASPAPRAASSVSRVW